MRAFFTLLLTCLFVASAHAKYSGGSGTADDPYQIATAADLIAIGETPDTLHLHEYFVLTADIDLDPNLPGQTVFDRAVIRDFRGVFNGNGHTVSHLTIKGGDQLGLFGYLGYFADVRDLGLVDADITGSGSRVGGLVGRNGSGRRAGNVTRCYCTGMVRGKEDVGGLVGHNEGTLSDCHSSGLVTGEQMVGGLAGSSVHSVIQCHSTGAVSGKDGVGGLVGYSDGGMYQCYSTGVVSGQGRVGGLAGCNHRGPVTECYSTASVVGEEDVGGLVGRSGSASDGTSGDTSKSYSAGVVKGNTSVGGLIGHMYAGTVFCCYSTANVSGRLRVGGLTGASSAVAVDEERRYPEICQCYSAGLVVGEADMGGLVGYSEGDVLECFWDTQRSGQGTSADGTGKTTAEMQTARTFLEAGWDFVNESQNGVDEIWWIREGRDYPRLWWERPAGIVFVDIPAGTFEMGDHAIAGYRDDQRPVHAVTLDAFQVSQCEITNAQYAQFLNATMAAGLIQVVNGLVYASSDANLAWVHCDTYASSPYSQIEYSQGRFTVRSRDGLAMSDHPMTTVSWYGATAFCDYYGYRLPTEAEWEYAARGGYYDPYYRYPWGSDDIDCSKANCKTDEGFCNPLGLTDWPYTVPVGYYGPQGAYGLCDMSGNLWEWCQDWYDPGYYAVSPTSDPAGPETGTMRVLRGGAWDVHGDTCHVADRCVGDPLCHGHVVGFRVCR